MVNALSNWSTAREGAPQPGIRTHRIDAGNLTIVRYSFEPNASFPLHRHPEEQTIVMLAGSCTLRTDRGRVQLAADDVAYSAPMEPHGVVAGPEGVVFLNIITPRRAQDRTEYLE